MELKKKLLFIVPIAALATAIDLITKAWAVKKLMYGPSITIIENFFDLRYVENTGMAWGIGKGLSTGIFVVLALVAMGVLVYFIVTVPFRHKFIHFALAIITGGAIGNLIDRLRLGYVVDFIDWHYYQYHWPTFNIADAFISVGITILIVAMLFGSGDPFGHPVREDSSANQSSQEGTDGDT